MAEVGSKKMSRTPCATRVISYCRASSQQQATDDKSSQEFEDSPEGRFIKGVQSFMAEVEVEEMARRIRLGHEKRGQQAYREERP